MPIAAFPFKYISTGFLGTIFRPYAITSFQSKDRKRWVPVELVVDTGADYTLLPKRYADLLGIDVNIDCKPETTLGVGGAESIYLYKALSVKLGMWNSKVPVGFLERDDIPALLGRLQFLEAMKVCFEKRIITFS